MGLFKKREKVPEKKGYFINDTKLNEWFNQLMRYNGNQLIDIPNLSSQDYIDYYINNAVVRGLLGTHIGNNIAELAEFIELQDEQGKELKHWSLDLLNQPNDLDTKRNILKGWSVFYNTTGNSYLYFSRGVGSKFSQAKELYLLPSHRIEIVRGGLTNPIKGFKLDTESFTNVQMNMNNVMFTREFNPDPDTLLGLSPLQAAANYCQILDTAEKRQYTALQNGGTGGIITPKVSEIGYNQEYLDRTEEEINDAQSAANKTKFLPLPMEYTKIGDTPADLTILATSKNAATALSYIYGVPIDAFSGESKYDNAKEVKKTIILQAALPLLNLFLESYAKMIKKIDSKFAGKFIVNTDKIEALRDSVTDTINLYDKAFASINMRYELLGYPRINKPYADEPVVPLGVTFGNTDIDVDETQN